MDIDDPGLIAAVKAASGCHELYKAIRLTGYRHAKDGSLLEIEIEILDAGPGTSPRYIVSAAADNGHSTSGNSDDNLSAALAAVAWNELDKPGAV
jgi:hypothetical protein